MDDKTPQTEQKEESLETPSTAASGSGASGDQGESLDGGSATQTETPSTPAADTKKKGGPNFIKRIIGHLNIYFLLFLFIAVLSAGIVFIGIERNKKVNNTPTVNTQTLDQSALNNIKGSDSTVGDAKQTLTIASNAIFSGQVLVRESLDVAGTLKVGGTLSLPGIAVSGAGTFDQITTNNLAVGNNETIQGQLSVQKGLVVTGGGSFSGPVSVPQLTVQSLQLSGDLQIVRHVESGGGTPGISGGTALGNGGTSSVSGSDTSGTVTLNVGGSPPVGCFATVNFAVKFNITPHVVITPVGSAAAGLSYYINRNTSSFTICATNAAPAGQSFSFDYIAFE